MLLCRISLPTYALAKLLLRVRDYKPSPQWAVVYLAHGGKQQHIVCVSVRDYVMREVESRRAIVSGKSRRKFCIPVYKALTYDYGTLRVCSLAPITTSSHPHLPRTNCAPFPRTVPACCPIEKNISVCDSRGLWISSLHILCVVMTPSSSATISSGWWGWCLISSVA